MWHRDDAELSGPEWRYTPQVDSKTEERNSKLAEANVKFRHQNAELVGANFKLQNHNLQLRRWCNHLSNVIASQKKQIKSIQADLEEVRTERDNLLAAGRHFDAILHREIVCSARPAPRAEFVPRPPTTLTVPNNGGEVDRTVSGVWLDGFLSPLPNCDPTTRSPFAEYTPKEKEELRRRLLTQRGPANARAGGHGKPLPRGISSAGRPESLQMATGPNPSIESSSRSSYSPQEACIPTANTSALVSRLGTGSPTRALKPNVAPVCPEERLVVSSKETSGKFIRSPYRGAMIEGLSASPPEANVGPDFPDGTSRVSSTEPSEERPKTLTGNVSDTTTGTQDEGQLLRGPCKSGNLGEESSKQSGRDDPCGETDDDCLEEGARTETDEPGLTEHDNERHGIDSGDIVPGVSSLDKDCRSERNSEEKPGASSLPRSNAKTSGDEAGIPDSLNSLPVSEAHDTKNEKQVAGSGSAADPLTIDEPEAAEPCDDSTAFAKSLRPGGPPAVIASRSARPAEEETSKHAEGNLNVSASPASSAWSSRYPHKLYSCKPAHDRGSCRSQGKRQDSVISGGSGVNETSVEDEISSDRYTHVTHCCWCFNERLELQAVALCEGCPRIICRQCMLKVGLRVPSGDNSRDSILPASSCRCLKFDSEFSKPPPTAQPEAHLIEQLWKHDLSLQFREPVDTESNPNYLSVITKEKMMDLATMAEKLRNRCYVTPRGQRKFLLDLQQIWSNCWKYAQYDPENKAPMPGIVSCTLILANMVDEYCRSNMDVPTLTLDDKSWLAARESLNQTRFCEMVKGTPHNSMTLPINVRQGSVEEHWMNDETKMILSSSSGSPSVKRCLRSPEDNSPDPEEIVSGTLFNLADVGDRLVQEAKRRRETRNDS